MAKNITPVYSLDARFSTDGTAANTSPVGVTLTTAANDYTGIAAANAVVFTADAVEGGYVQRLRLRALGTNVATVLRIYINNGGVATTAANNTYIDEIALPATTASAVALTGPSLARILNLRLPLGFRIVVGLATAVAAGWKVTAEGAKY